MKNNAIARIVIFSLVILLLLCILLAGLGVGAFVINIGHSGSGDYITGSSSAAASQVSKLDIDWASGSITIRTEDTDTITFTEEGYGTEEYRMVYAVNNGTLSIKYSKPSPVQIGFFSTPSKDLTITVPTDWVCAKLSIDSASTDTQIEDLTLQKVELNSASNSFRFINCQIGTLDVDGASNSIELTGTLERLDCDGMSTNITAVLSNTPKQIELDGMSSDLELTLPGDCGFRVTMDGLSNDFSSDFSASHVGGCYVYGDEACRIDVDGMSSRVTIRKGE